jgi:transposase-like protein
LVKEEDKFVDRTHNKYTQIANDFIAVCPSCNCTKITIRKRKTPKYRCKECGSEFDDPKAMFAYKTRKQKYDYGRQYSNADE